MRKSENEASEDEETEIDSHKGTERTENGLQRDEATSGTSWAHLSPSCSSDIHPNDSPLDSLGITGPTRGAARKVFKVTVSDEDKPSKKRLNQVL